MTGWRKSSFSDGNTDCVEVAPGAGRVGVRDSKNPSGPTLTFPTTDWRRGCGVFKTYQPCG